MTMETRRKARFDGAKVTDGCDSLSVGFGSQMWILQKSSLT